MRPFLPRAFFAGLAAFALLSAPPTARAGTAAPAFTVRTVEGKTLRLADLKGRPVVLDFWAMWCVPCRASIPHLSTLQVRYRDRGLVVIGLSVDDEEPQTVRRFAERVGASFRMGMADERVLDSYGPLRAIPTTFFIDRRGQIVRRVVGYIDAETMEGFVRELF